MNARPVAGAALVVLLLLSSNLEAEPMNAPMPSVCVDAMRALIEGRLDAWPGLPRGCGRQAAEAAFGPGEGGPDGVAPLEGTATAFRRYGPSPRVPHAVQVWLRDEAILAIEVAGLVPAGPLDELLGPAEAIERSGLGSVHSQHIHASRELVLHVQNITGAIVRAYGFPSCTLAQFNELPWGRLQVERRPVR